MIKIKVQWPVAATRLLVLAVLCVPSIGHAYVGPNIGITLLSALVTVFAAIFIGLLGIMFWPIRAWLRRRSRAGQTAEDQDQGGEAADAAEDPQPIAAVDDARMAVGQGSRRKRGGA